MKRVAWSIVAAVALASVAQFAFGQASKERAYVDAVLDGLVKAGVIKADQAAQIKKDAEAAATGAAAAEKPKKSWTDTVKVSGYGQVRWQHSPDADDPDNVFSLRRARLKITANPTERVEGQFEVSGDDTEMGITDAWLQYQLDDAGEWRVRGGQQRIPFGFEVPQPTQSVIPLELSWVGRTMFPGLRDLGTVVYWTSPEDRARFEEAKKTDLGTGDYGNVAIGLFNGQGMSEPEANSSKSLCVRLAKPFSVDGHYAEGGVSYWTGKFHSDAAAADLDDNLLGVHVYVPPHPIGLQAEYYNGETEGDDINGFYAMGLWKPREDGTAFVRYDEYNGPRKGRGLGNVFDRERWSFGYAHMVNSNTKATIQYDLQDTPAGNDDLLATQLQVGF
ncbi:MAG: hypothetical protein FJX75_11930 [Armatimonadetes bacterium]|nr:hypothetical protein [Armatimonadota bacterium]